MEGRRLRALAHALPRQSFARRRRCACRARIRSRHKEFLEGRFRACRSQVADRLHRRGHSAGRDGFRPSLDDCERLSADSEIVEARRDAERGKDFARGQGHRRADRRLDFTGPGRNHRARGPRDHVLRNGVFHDRAGWLTQEAAAAAQRRRERRRQRRSHFLAARGLDLRQQDVCQRLAARDAADAGIAGGRRRDCARRCDALRAGPARLGRAGRNRPRRGLRLHL